MSYFKVFIAAREVRKAIIDKGSHPEYHDYVMRTHRKEWPTLWKALDKLVRAVNEEAG